MENDEENDEIQVDLDDIIASTSSVPEEDPVINNRNKSGSVRSFDARISVDDQLGLLSSRPYNKERIVNTVKPGALNFISNKYESLDYDTYENELLLNEELREGYGFVVRKTILKWIIFLLIGVITALFACVINISIIYLGELKYGALQKFVDNYAMKGQLYIPYLYWLLFNLVPVFIGSILVSYVEPIAGGSGIPQVKCYLNGVKIPRVVRIRTLFVKAIGVICSVVGGLAGGKEGPMIHIGAVVAAGISQGKSTTFNTDLNILRYFREDQEKRDFVSGGAAAGVSAAFGAPVGGVLFSLEEGASFWNQSLTWRIFFATAVSTFTLNFFLSLFYGHPGNLQYPGLLNLGQFEDFKYEVYELPIFALVGAFGGVLGALWNSINYKLSVFRLRYINRRWLKVLEACLVAMMTATAGFLMIYTLNDCKPLGKDPTKFPTQLYCGDGDYNALASIWFQTPEESVRSFLHDPPNTHNVLSLVVFVIAYFFIASWTFGLASSNGIFIPLLLIGSAWGRILSSVVYYINPQLVIYPGKYALIGAAAQLGGCVRMTLSLAVIIMETTSNISYGLPLIITLIAAKWTGDFFNEGIYDIHIQLGAIPFLSWEPPPLTHNIFASEVMAHPVTTLRNVEKVGRVVDMLKTCSYNGFPVVDPPLENNGNRFGKLRGLILRSQLIVIMKKKLFVETTSRNHLNTGIFRDFYPRYPTIDEIALTSEELECSIDLSPFMNPSPYTVQFASTSLPRMFRLFRALGLRHLVVVNDANEVIGMVTRKDLARYREWRHRGRIGVEELLISKDS